MSVNAIKLYRCASHGEVAHRCSPVHSCLKFSAVLGTISLNSSILMRPADVSPILMSKKTMGRVGAEVADVAGTSAILIGVRATEMSGVRDALVKPK